MPWFIMRSIAARVGTEKPQVGILQLATVKPQPHWQVRPSETSEFVVVSAANVSRETFFSSGEINTNITAARNTSDTASVNLARTDSITPRARRRRVRQRRSSSD